MFVTHPAVRGGVLDAPRLWDCQGGLDATVRPDRWHPRHPRCVRLASTAQRIQSRGHRPRTISHGRPTPSFIPGRAGVEARPYGGWRGILSSPTLHQPLSHGAKRRDSSPFRGAEGGCGAITLSVITRRAGVEARPYGRHPELTRAALLLLTQIAPCYFGQNVLI